MDCWQRLGVRIVQSEFHHAAFEVDEAGAARSTFRIVIHATNAEYSARFQVEGPIEVQWSDRRSPDGHFVPQRVDATGLAMSWREGGPLFERSALAEVPFRTGHDDLMAHDLDGDGLSEILYPPANVVFRNRGGGRFEKAALCAHPTAVIGEAVLADFTGDGQVDLLVAGANPPEGAVPKRMVLFLYDGDVQGRFNTHARRVVDPRAVALTAPRGFAVGDVDGDGDLDLFAPQYKPPYAGGQFPTPYYDANDGFPAYLLLNGADGQFVDATESAGLTSKRFRRAYRSSFIDLDDDDDLDLIVVSDFAGLDLYENDGTGRFTDVTSAAVDEAVNFGMAHTLADFNGDGMLDLYVTGMASTTARRLHRMGLSRPDMPEHEQMRMPIAYGNRLYLCTGPGSFRQPAFRDSVSRSGWSWGVVSLDFNNDGFPDIYVCNGNKSGRTAKDYCVRFWCHDIYSGSSRRDAAFQSLFLDEARAYTHDGMSWNGFEHNHLFLNQRGGGFTNVAFLMGTALEEDCRAVIADDLDADGRPDLVVASQVMTTFKRQRTLHLLMNRAPQTNHWIGVRLQGSGQIAPWGARIMVSHGGRTQTAAVVTGDSFSAQHAPVRHFGLGAHDTVDHIEVRWPNGTMRRLDRPAVDQYHEVVP